MKGKASPRPWSMKWVVLAIILFVLGYTWVMLKYRKQNTPYRPYQDSVDRTTVSRLLASGYQRLNLQIERPSDPSPSLVLAGTAPAKIESVFGGLPGELDFALVEKPLLADSYPGCIAPSSTRPSTGYGVLLKAQLPDNDRMISDVVLFKKDKELILLPLFEKLEGKLQARWKETSVICRIPQDQLSAGHYQVLLVGQKNSRKWSFSVQP